MRRRFGPTGWVRPLNIASNIGGMVTTSTPQRRAIRMLFTLLALVIIATAAVAPAVHFSADPLPRTLVAISCGAVGAVLGGLLVIGIRRAGSTARRYLVGLGVTAVAIALRLGPWFFGSANTIGLIRPVVVGEIAAVLAVIGVGVMLSSLRPDDVRISHRGLSGRPLVRLAGLLLAIAPIVPFAVASTHDLGPLVVLLSAVVVMAAVSLGQRWFFVIATLVLAWIAVVLLNTVDLARDRLTEIFSGGYQLGVARAAIAYGGMLWGGGFGSNGFAEAIPVAESDHLAAYLAATAGVAPFLVVVAGLFWLLSRLAGRIPAGVEGVTVAAGGLVVAATAQLAWAVLGSFGVLPLTGIGMPAIAMSGSSWLAWGTATGFLLTTIRSRRSALSRTSTSGAAGIARTLRHGVGAAGVLTCATVFVTGAGLIGSPPPSGVGGALSTLVDRGDLVSADGVVLATTANDGTRTWPLGEITVEAVGAVRASVNQYGLEAAASPVTTCGGGAGLLAGLIGPRCSPTTAVSSLHAGLQQEVAYAATMTPGTSVVVLDAANFAIRAAYSSPLEGPRPDPAGLATGKLDLDQFSPLLKTSPFAPDIFTEPISPGSIFKLPVLAVAAQYGLEGADDGTFTDGALGVWNAFGGGCPHDDTITAIKYSCNTVAAGFANELGQQSLAEGLHRYFGLDGGVRTLDGIESSAGTTGLDGAALSATQLSRTSIGLESVRVTVLELAQIVAHAIGEGVEAAPTLLLGSCREGDAEIRPASSVGATVGEPLDPDVALLVRAGMASAVENGTAEALLRGVELPLGITVLAKTGTPDRMVEGFAVNDSLIAVVVDGTVLVVRVAGSPQNPKPNVDSPAIDVARTLLSSIAATLVEPALCSEVTQ